MDRVSVVALLVASSSVVLSAVTKGNVEVTVRHGAALILPLAVSVFPEVLDSGFRRSRGGHAHGGEGPAPAAVLRVAAWVLLVTMIVVHHD